MFKGYINWIKTSWTYSNTPLIPLSLYVTDAQWAEDCHYCRLIVSCNNRVEACEIEMLYCAVRGDKRGNILCVQEVVTHFI